MIHGFSVLFPAVVLALTHLSIGFLKEKKSLSRRIPYHHFVAANSVLIGIFFAAFALFSETRIVAPMIVIMWLAAGAGMVTAGIIWIATLVWDEKEGKRSRLLDWFRRLNGHE